VIAHDDAPEKLRTGTDVDMSTDSGQASYRPPRSEGDLLKDQAIRPDLCAGMDNDSVRVR
jgi:hypothetical protein